MYKKTNMKRCPLGDKQLDCNLSIHLFIHPSISGPILLEKKSKRYDIFVVTDPKCSVWNRFYLQLCAAFLCSSIWKSKKFLFPSPCSRESWEQSPHSAQQDKLSHSVVFRPVQALAQMTESLSRGTATSAGEYLHVSQPVCFFLRLNLSSFHCLFILVFSLPLSFFPTRFVCQSLSRGKQGIGSKGQKGSPI